MKFVLVCTRAPARLYEEDAESPLSTYDLILMFPRGQLWTGDHCYSICVTWGFTRVYNWSWECLHSGVFPTVAYFFNRRGQT